MWTIQPEHSTEKWNVICSLKSLCTQQIMGLDVFSTSVTWVSLVDSVQQSLIRVCPFLYHSWGKMNLCACFPITKRNGALVTVPWQVWGSCHRATQMRGCFCIPRAAWEIPLPTAACLGEMVLHSWDSAGFVKLPPKKALNFPSDVQSPRSCCAVFLCWGRVWLCWKRTNCLLFPQVFAQAGAWGGWQCKNWDDVVILRFPELVLAFCVMQNDCNWEYLWDKLPLWLSNMSAVLFMFICRVCNSYKLLLHDRLLHLNFSLLNSFSSFLSFDSITILHLDPRISVPHGVCCVRLFVAITTWAELSLLAKFLWSIVLEWSFLDVSLFPLCLQLAKA